MKCLTSAFLTSLIMAPVFVKLNENELNRIKLLLNNQLDSDYRKSVWSPFVCGDVESVKVQTVPKNTKKSTSWATTVWIDWAEYWNSYGCLRSASHLRYSVQSIHTVVTHDVLFFVFFGTV